MSRSPPPLLGFNNNVRHQGRIFHIQTEDSGVKYPRIVTHLFADGGRILKTTRTDYAEHVGRDDMATVVRRMMKEQHKGMFISLRSGEYDDIIAEACGPPASAVNPDAPESLRMPESLPAGAPRVEPEPAEAAKEAEATAAEPRRSSRPPKKKRGRALTNPNLRRVTPSVPPPAGDFDLDVNSIDAHPPKARPKSGRPPPPVAAAPPPPPRVTPAHGTPPVASGPGKYAPSRPAAIFDEPKSPDKQSIFGESVISEKSLDEVILSYLAEDLEGPSE